MRIRGPVLGLALFAAGLVVLGAMAFYVLPQAQRASDTSSLVGGPFSLVDQNGKTVTDADMRGKPFLVFFGFTHCPDICPTTLFELSEALNRLGPDAEKVSALFVTVDPERDTPEVLTRYLSSFSPRISGLGGDQARVDAMVKAYRAYARKVPLDDGTYTMDHTAIVYIMDADGRFVRPLNMARTPDEVAAELRSLL